MKKLIALIALSLMCSMGAFSQTDGVKNFGYGARVGINIADFTSSTGSARSGLKVGGFIDYNVSRLGFELGCYYSQVGSNEIVQQGVVGNKLDLNLDYIDLALLVKYNVFGRFKVFAGPQCGFLVNAQRVYTDNAKEDVGDSTNPLMLSIIGGVGYTFKFGLDLSASYSHGLTPLFNTEAKHYNSTYNVTVGWRF